MNISEVIKNRTSLRGYDDRMIEDQDLEKILEAASLAPTAGNQQLYSVIVIKSQETKDKLSESCDHQPFIAKAKMVLIFCADYQKWYDAFQAVDCESRKPGPGDLMLACSDANIAAQNAVTAAWSLGIGSCYIGDIMELREVHRELLHLPEYVFPTAMLVFGYGNEQQMNRKKPERARISDIVCENGYHRKEKDQLKEMFQYNNCPGRDYEAWMKAFCNRKYNSDFAKEMSRSVGEYWKQFEE